MSHQLYRTSLLCLLFLSCFISDIFAQTYQREWEKESPKEGVVGYEVLSGWGTGKLMQGPYETVPVFVDIDYDLKHVIGGESFPPLLQFIVEPFAYYVYKPKSNSEAGVNFLLKIGLVPDDWKIQPFFIGGAGLNYMTLHTKEQGSQFNFNEFAGLGLHYFFDKNVALTAEYRYRHLSNADLGEYNYGIGANFALAGISYFF